MEYKNIKERPGAGKRILLMVGAIIAVINIVLCFDYAGLKAMASEASTDKFSSYSPFMYAEIYGVGKIALVHRAYEGVEEVEHYEYYCSENPTSGYKLLGTDYGYFSYTVKNLKINKTYYFKCRGFKTVDGKKIYTQESAVVSAKTVGAPAAPRLRARLLEGGKVLILSWNRKANIDGISIYRKIENGSYKKIKTLGGTKVVYRISLKSYNPNYKYSFYIRTCKEYPYINIWSKPSNIKILKIGKR